MCVSGMLPARQDHARAALRLALDLHAAAAAVDAGGGCGVQIRVALHTGPVTSGVIGHLRARFALFGDTVTTASALEAAGCAGAVQLSEAAFEASGLPSGAVPERRVSVKGNGQMNSACPSSHACMHADAAPRVDVC
jgi:class 3 adenylate cyclase